MNKKKVQQIVEEMWVARTSILMISNYLVDLGCDFKELNKQIDRFNDIYDYLVDKRGYWMNIYDTLK